MPRKAQKKPAQSLKAYSAGQMRQVSDKPPTSLALTFKGEKIVPDPDIKNTAEYKAAKTKVAPINELLEEVFSDTALNMGVVVALVESFRLDDWPPLLSQHLATEFGKAYERRADRLVQEGKAMGLHVVFDLGRTKGSTPANGRKYQAGVYTNPVDSRQTWKGRGRRPIWLINYEDQGGDVETLRS